MLDPLVLPVLLAPLALLAPRLLDRATPLLDSMPRRFSSRASTPHLVLAIGAVAVVAPVPVPVLDMILGSPVCRTLLLRVGSRLGKVSRPEPRARGITLDTPLGPMDRRVRQVPQACRALLRPV